jgi:hypothetical protein
MEGEGEGARETTREAERGRERETDGGKQRDSVRNVSGGARAMQTRRHRSAPLTIIANLAYARIA